MKMNIKTLLASSVGSLAACMAAMVTTTAVTPRAQATSTGGLVLASSDFAKKLHIGIDVTKPGGNAFRLTFTNNSAIQSSITKVWLESGLFSSGVLDNSPGSRRINTQPDANFYDGTNVVRNIPGLLKGTNWFGTGAAALASRLRPTNGIDTQGSDRLSFTIDVGAVATPLNSFVQSLQDTGNRIGLLIDGLPGDNRVGLITALNGSTPIISPNNPNPNGQPQPATANVFDIRADPAARAKAQPVAVPTPAAFAIGLPLLVGFTLRRRAAR